MPPPLHSICSVSDKLSDNNTNHTEDDENVNEKEVKSVTIGNEKFSIKLYHLLREKHENFVFSPFSISAVMPMVSAGAREETLKQIEKGLFFTPSSILQAEYKNIIPAIRSTQDFTIQTANKMFVQKDFSILKEFQQILIKSFHTNIQDIDFRDAQAAVNEINGWVEDVTRDIIKDLLQPYMVKDASLVLVNAIYFKSNWATKFDKAQAKKFLISSSSSVEVPMMSKTDTVFIANLEGLSSSMVEMPYKGNRIVMQVLLPNTKFGLKDLEEKLKGFDINELFEKEKRKTSVRIGLPKFKLESTLPLNEELGKLGLKNMFSEFEADLSGITGTKELFVSAVIQKAFIEVNEEGTEAAAATAVVIGFGRSGGGDEPIQFIADHPFIFYLRDKESGMLLFKGRVINPLK